MSRRATSAIVASPVLVGAVTTLILVVAVFLAYNANRGLPFVPTYDVSVQLPSGSNLTPQAAVRAGGFRVGQIKKIRTDVTRKGTAVAAVDLQLDKLVDPLPSDTTAIVRPRSALGLKEIELFPGISDKPLQPGDTIPLSQADLPVEFDDFLNTFNRQLRDDTRTSLQGYGDAFAGRGQSINIALQELPQLFEHLTPVMDNLNDEDTQLDEFFKNIGRASAEAAPVARVQAELFTDMADTFEAMSRHPQSLQAMIEKGPETMDVSVRSFRVQRPFLSNFRDLSRKLKPVARILDRRLFVINDALDVGAPTLRASVQLNEETERMLDDGLETLVDDPDTMLALRDLRSLTTVTAPLLRYAAPYQTVCNATTSFFTGLGDHQSEQVGSGGTIERILVKEDNMSQDDRLSTSTSDRPADVPQGQDPDTAMTIGPRGPKPLTKLNGDAYVPAVDARGNADCESGQYGFPDGPQITNGRYPPSPDPEQNGGSHVVMDADTPGRVGPTGRGGVSKVRFPRGPRNLNQIDRHLRRHGVLDR